jgi:hypothetical protein
MEGGGLTMMNVCEEVNMNSIRGQNHVKRDDKCVK